MPCTNSGRNEMARKNSLKEVPFEESWRYEGDVKVSQGWHMTSYPSGYRSTDWRPNEPFEATLKLVGQSRGRSSALFEWEDVKTGTRYPMFLSSLGDLVRNSMINFGQVAGKWVAVKKGANYGIERYDE